MSAAEKSACPEGNELSVGWGIRAVAPDNSIAPGLHWGKPRLIIL